jgi:hypothetical protein
VYFEINHGNRPYAGSFANVGLGVINKFKYRELMGPDNKFGDIGAGIGRILAVAVASIDVGEAIGFEIDDYLIEKGKKAIDKLHDLGVLDKSRIRWIRGDWRNSSKEIRKLNAAYIYPPKIEYDFADWDTLILIDMQDGSWLYNAATDKFSNKQIRPTQHKDLTHST